jgi:2-O-methyltransferase
MRKLIDFLIALYLLPLRMNSRLALYVKGKILQYDGHYVATVDVIRKKFPYHQGLVVDIGAFDADSTVFFAKAFSANRILGFEPNPSPFHRAVENARGYKNIELFNLGFSDRSGEMEFHLTKDPVSSSLFNIKESKEISYSNTIQIKVTTLDGKEDILLMKLDVQGAELKILQQGSETLKRTKLVLAEVLNSELYDGSCMYHEVDECLRKNGFIVYSLFADYNDEGTKYYDVLYINSTSESNNVA